MDKVISAKIIPVFFSLISLIFAGEFLYQTIQSSFHGPNILWIIVTFIMSAFAIIGLRNEFKAAEKQVSMQYNRLFLSKGIKSILVTVSNTMVTYLIVTYFGFSTILSASIVCLISAIFLPNYEAEAYSGSVAGMIGAYLCSHWAIALLTGMVTGVVFIVFSPYFKGIGGRGGSIPYIATMISVRLILSLNPAQRQPIEVAYIFPSLLAIILATFITYLLHQQKILSIVKSAMVVVLLSSIFLPDSLYTITTAIFAGTIVGMSTESRIDNNFHLLVVSIICFILFIPSFNILDGIGGKLGFLSLLSYQASIGLKIAVTYITQQVTIQKELFIHQRSQHRTK